MDLESRAAEIARQIMGDWATSEAAKPGASLEKHIAMHLTSVLRHDRAAARRDQAEADARMLESLACKYDMPGLTDKCDALIEGAKFLRRAGKESR